MAIGYWSSRNDMKTWSETVEKEAKFQMDPLISHVARRVQHQSLNILDLGSGDGRFTPHLIVGNRSVVGIENSSLIDRARRRKAPKGPCQEISYHDADILDGLPFLNSRKFDLVLAIHTLHFIEWHERFTIALDVIGERTKNNGSFIFVGHTPHQSLLEKVTTGLSERGFSLSTMDIDSIPENIILEMQKK